MPEISRFYGIVIKMYYNDHQPPHFHAEYSGDMMVVNFNTLAVIAGKFSPRATGLVMEWAAQHQTELQTCGIKLAILLRSTELTPCLERSFTRVMFTFCRDMLHHFPRESFPCEPNR